MQDSSLFDPEGDDRGPKRELQLFDNGEFQLQIDYIGDTFVVRAPGLARALGFRDATNMLANVPAAHKGYFLPSTSDGSQQVTEAGFYRLIGKRQAARIKNEEVREQVERFQDWVFGDVLPTIRRTGSYGRPRKAEIDLSDPLAELEELNGKLGQAIAIAKQERAARMIEAAGRKAAEERNAILGPKADQADQHRAADGLLTFGDFANKLKAWAQDNLGVRVLHQDVWDFARESGLLIKSTNTLRKNRVTSFGTDNGYVREKESEYEDRDGNLHIAHTPRLTPKGEGWLWDRTTTRLKQTGTLRKAIGGAA